MGSVAAVRHDKRADIHKAFSSLECAQLLRGRASRWVYPTALPRSHFSAVGLTFTSWNEIAGWLQGSSVSLEDTDSPEPRRGDDEELLPDPRSLR